MASKRDLGAVVIDRSGGGTRSVQETTPAGQGGWRARLGAVAASALGLGLLAAIGLGQGHPAPVATSAPAPPTATALVRTNPYWVYSDDVVIERVNPYWTYTEDVVLTANPAAASPASAPDEMSPVP